MDRALDHVKRAGGVLVALLIVIGVIASGARSYVIVKRSEATLRALQQGLMGMMSDDEGQLAAWTRQMSVMEQRFTTHDVVLLLHTAAGGVFLLLAPLQFSARMRRHRALHRWLGRALLLIAIPSALAGLFFGLVIPVGGIGEMTSTGFFGALFVFAMLRAFIAIRAHDVATHREWMIRAFAVGLGISTIRIIGSVIQTFAPMPVQDAIAPMFWLGWGITSLVAEWWIRATRRSLSTHVAQLHAEVEDLRRGWGEHDRVDVAVR